MEKENFKIVLAQVNAIDIPEEAVISSDAMDMILNDKTVRLFYRNQLKYICGTIKKMTKRVLTKKSDVNGIDVKDMVRTKLNADHRIYDGDIDVQYLDNEVIAKCEDHIFYFKNEDFGEKAKTYHSEYYLTKITPYFAYDYLYYADTEDKTVNNLAKYINEFADDKDVLDSIEDGTVLKDLLAQIWRPNTVLYIERDNAIV